MKLILTILTLLLPFLFALLLDTSISIHVILINSLIIIITNVFLKKYPLLYKSHVKYILIYTLFISIIAIISYSSSIKSGSISDPYIPGGDGEFYYQSAKLLTTENPFADQNFFKANYLGYQIILSLLFKLFGTSLFIGLGLNYILLILSILIILIISFVLTNDPLISKYTLIISMMIPQFASMGTLLLKDIIIIFSFALFT